MTSARRVAAIVDFDVKGRALGGYQRGGMQVDYVETVARYLVAEGADEIWLRLAAPDLRGAAGLFDPIRTLAGGVFVPVVAWGAVRTASDARLVTGMGADRVVVACSDPELSEPAQSVAQIAQAVGGDRVSAAVVVRRVAKTHSFTWERCLIGGAGTGEDAIDFLIELCRAGAGEIILIPSYQGQLSAHPTDLVERLAALVEVQVASVGAEKEAADLAAPLLMGADAAATSTLFRDGSTTLHAVKEMLLGMGIPVRPARPPYLQPR